MSEPDQSLIAEFNGCRSEAAFAALVRQHVNLVFATAMRQVGDAGAAEEITQNVFVALAQAAGKLGSHPTIAGWLHQTALHKSREWLRAELRRRKREQLALNLETARSEGDSVWSPLVPLLDEALLELREPDRQAVILHYLEDRSFREVGSLLGVGEDAARKRVNRCLEQLTHFFRRQGFAVPALAPGAPLFALSTRAATAGLAASSTTAGLAAAHSAASTSTLTLIKGALKIMAWTKAKTVILAGAAVILAASTTTLVVHHQHQDHRQPKPQPVEPTETDFPKSSWTFAGYADPQSALLSALWSFSTGDLETFLASLTPGERERQQQQLKSGAQRAGKSPAEYFTTTSTTGDMPKTKGFRVLDRQVISDDQVILRISIEGTGRGKEQQVVAARMKKTGNEWKVDSIGPQ